MVEEATNRETIKNQLRGRTCETCARFNRFSGQLSAFRAENCKRFKHKPDSGVCSQWMKDWTAKSVKFAKHKRDVHEKRRKKKTARTQAAQTTNPVNQEV